MHFAISGIEVSPLVPFLVALCVSALTSMGGISGAFVLLPFQVSVLGFVGPAVTPTNHLFNVIAIPSGVYRYVREQRMVWPIAAVTLVGTLPGVVAGSLVRIYLLPDPRDFKLFMGMVLAVLGCRMAHRVLALRGAAAGTAGAPPPELEGVGPAAAEPAPVSRAESAAAARSSPRELAVETRSFGWRRLEYRFEGEIYRVSTPALAALTAIIGVVGGAYGVGGGSIIAPILVSMLGLPVHTVAGAALLGTWLTSAIAVLLFTVAGPLLGIPSVAPDWWLGALLGAGGSGGMYLGARLQKRCSARWIEGLLGAAVTTLALSYIAGFFCG